ncbi:hypothetical protein SLEP1_g38957 [Rubroshorea leprosula]|uniref:Reverse transcriptase domain-containing protein n=1 Tax=Rubroshorea leprosula TaxID=152421 RepID=A0AAV5KZD4_9ROSI|nr:hypothetical protein SLEP1_g38957 [Rubroshorea leprosula]
MNGCNMMDLGFTGGRFTWVNMQFNGHIIRECLDRVWGNLEWRISFPQATVFHLPRVHSDHNPILLYLNPSRLAIGKQPFRLEKFWIDHPEFQSLGQGVWQSSKLSTSQCISNMMSRAESWSKATFGNLFKRKKKILARLEGIYKYLSLRHNVFLSCLEKDLALEYADILKFEEDLWFMKSRTNWLLEEWDSSQLQLSSLAHPPTMDEIWRALNSMKPFKAPGSDGVHPFFYQKLWEHTRSKVCIDILQAFSTSTVPLGWNNCLLVLIPKVENPESITQFRPIGLCNTSYKIISKLLVNRIKPLLDTIISPCQASFIPGRKGTDNVIILQELIHSFNKKTGCTGDMIIKIDLEKASGQKINPSKFGIFFSRNVEHNSREELCSILEFPQTENLRKYLGVPPSPRKLKKQDCNFILDKVRAKLDGWKTKFFSMAERRILASSVLASIPNFYMQSFMLSYSTLSQLDKITRDFLWGFDLLKRKIHMVAWDTVTLPKSLGGLGMKSAKEANLVAMAKLNWRLFSKRDKLWCQIIASKYGIGTQPSPLPRNGSPMLNNIRKGSELFQKGIKWVPYNGRSISFWNDCWVMDAPLSNLLSGPISSQDRQLTVADAFVNRRFQPNNISYPIEEDLVRIISTTPTAITSSNTDSFCWKGSSDGSFSSTFAYNLAKGLHLSPKGDWKWIWKIQTLPKIQQFIWLLSHERLKTLGGILFPFV